MKLTETAQYQNDDEELFGEPRLSFTFTTRNEEQGELIQKEFTFSNAKEWDKWMLHHYVEKRCDEGAFGERNWRKCEDVHWQKAHLSGADIHVPQVVIEKLDEMFDIEVIRIQE